LQIRLVVPLCLFIDPLHPGKKHLGRMLKLFKRLKDELKGPKDEDGIAFLEELQTTHSPPPSFFPAPTWKLPLPPEIMYIIIDSYTPTNDLDTLKALCVTCRCLRPYASQRIFSDISIGAGDYIGHGDEMQKPDRFAKTQAERFARVIHHSPHLIASTHTLRIFHAKGHNAPYPMSREEASLIYILSRDLKNLTSLHLICRFHWAYLLYPVKDAFLDALKRPTLREVELENVIVPLDSIESWNFRRLNLTSVLFMPLNDDTDIFGQFEELCFGDVVGFTRFLVSYYGWKPFPHLHTLKYKGTREGVPLLPSVLKRCPSLERLQIDPSDDNSPFVTTLNLKNIPTTLKRLILSTIAALPPYLVEFGIFSTDNSIERITFVIRSAAPKRVGYWDWREVDDVFSPPGSWKFLKMVEVIACTNEEIGFETFYGDLISVEHDGISSLAERAVVNWYHT
ncbi:uncharacterized protein LACBIDRAFT_332464, partial [Laccaria bicolor S238N-H82]